MKIVFFAEILVEDFDGASRTMFQLIRRIPAAHFEFMFVCGVGPEELMGFECVRIPSFTVPVNTSYKMAFPLLVQARLKEKLNAFNPDVIHIATPSLLGQFALKFAKKYSLPVISIYHTHFISYIDYYLRNIPFAIGFVKEKVLDAQNSFYNQCDKVYIPSESIANELIESGVNRSVIKIWKRGIDTKLFSPEKKDIAWIRKLTGNDRPVILFASRLVWEKNLETLFRIYDLLQYQKANCTIVVAGDGSAMDICRSKMSKAVFLGKIDHETLARLYASSDIFLFPSISETYGNVVIEAMASGVPCVIADGGGSKDFIKHGVNGFKCEPLNETDFAEKIQYLLRNKMIARLFAERGRAYSLEFDWGQLAEVYFKDLEDMVMRDAELKLA